MKHSKITNRDYIYSYINNLCCVRKITGQKKYNKFIFTRIIITIILSISSGLISFIPILKIINTSKYFDKL